jgi:hypothetical protein
MRLLYILIADSVKYESGLACLNIKSNVDFLLFSWFSVWSLNQIYR